MICRKWRGLGGALLIVALSGLVLAGCGGGGGGGGSSEGPNAAPVADAGADQSVETGALVTLDGSGSFDPNGDEITYGWSFVSRPSGSAAALSDATTVRPTFTADVEGSYVIRLVVSDGDLQSDPDEVVVTAATANAAPVADAGVDQSVETGSLVTLDGSGSFDPNGDGITYQWSFVSRPPGSAAALSDAAGVRPTFTADVDGSYVVRLVVSDGDLESAPDEVVVTAATANAAPVADAGPDQNVETGALVTLDGSGSSDPNGDGITYQWAFVSRPTGSAAALSGATGVRPSFTADVEGSYVIRLVVSDGDLQSAPDEVVVTAATANAAPVADAGADQSVETGALVTLDGSGSSDPNGDGITYGWSFVSRPSGSTAALSDATTVRPTFTADVEGSYVIRLVVSDGDLTSDPDEVVVTAATANAAPIADAGVDQSVATGTTVTLDGSGSFDPNGDGITYGWSFVSRPSGSTAPLSGATGVRPTFTADVAGSYVVRLVVSDAELESPADQVVVTAVPVAEGWGLPRDVDPAVEAPSAPAVLALGGGNSLAAWEDGGSVWFSEGDSSGGWGTPVRLDTAGVAVGSPALGRDSAGMLLAVWAEPEGVRWSRRPQGEDWSAPSTVATTAGAASALTLALNGQGSGLAAWESGGTIAVRGYAKPANSWGVLPSLNPGEGQSSSPQAGVDDGNRVLVVWVLDGELWFSGNILSESPPAWSTPVRIDGGTDPVSGPSLAVQSDGSALCAWLQAGGVWAASYDPDTGWSAPAALDTLGTGAESPRLAGDGQGDAMAVWLQAGAVWAAHHAGATGWGAATELEAGPDAGSSLAVGVGADGSAVAAWSAEGGIRAARYDPAGGWGDPGWIRVTDAQVSDLRVSVGEDGAATALWAEDGARLVSNWYDPGP